PRTVGGDVLGTIEMREVSARDFLRAPAVNPLGAAVPAAHEAARIDQEEGVIAHRVDEEAEALLASSLQLLLAAAFGEIAGDLRESEEGALGVAQRRDHDVGPEPCPVLAQPPALILEAAFHRRDLQLVLRPLAFHRIRRVEAREVAADDLVTLVSFDEAGAGIRTRHITA